MVHVGFLRKFCRLHLHLDLQGPEQGIRLDKQGKWGMLDSMLEGHRNFAAASRLLVAEAGTSVFVVAVAVGIDIAEFLR